MYARYYPLVMTVLATALSGCFGAGSRDGISIGDMESRPVVYESTDDLELTQHHLDNLRS